MKSYQRCQFSFEYQNYSLLLKSRPGDCRVYCIYESFSSPLLQEGENDCCKLILLWN